jgi:ribosomal protein L7Ae-like RNA K-turn-binding protein
VLLASDAAENLSRRMLRLAEESGCVALTVPFQKAELGQRWAVVRAPFWR